MIVLSPDYNKTVFELDTEDLPPCQINTLMDALLRGVKAFYIKPGADEYFENWKRDKAAKTAK